MSTDIRAYVTANGGATVRVSDGTPVEPKSGYAVGLASGTAAFVPSEASDIEFLSTISRVAREFGSEFVGLWLEGGTFHVDPSAVVPTIREARRLGRRNGQIAVWDFANSSEIRLWSR